MAPEKGMKLCSRCRQSKPATEYYRYKPAKDGLRYQCKTCQLQVKRERRGTQTQRQYQPKETCLRCRKRKLLSQFHSHSRRKSGRCQLCIKCHKEIAGERVKQKQIA